MYGQKRPLFREQPHGVAIEDSPEKPNAPNSFESWDARRTTLPPNPAQSQARLRKRVISFAGLREGEIRGQWWEDDDGDVLNIRRSVWRTHLKDETKTPRMTTTPVSFRSSSLFDLCSMRSSPRMHLAGCSQIESAGRWIWTTLPSV